MTSIKTLFLTVAALALAASRSRWLSPTWAARSVKEIRVPVPHRGPLQN